MNRSTHLSFFFAAFANILLGQSNILTEPPTLKSEKHQLDILMVAKPNPISLAGFRPTEWTYEVCRRKNAIGNACPAGHGTVAPYGGVRLALDQGDHLKIRLVNQLPPAPPDAEHAHGPMGDMLADNPTNLHTHGLIVEPRRATRSDGTYGDYVYVLGYPAGKLPSMQDPGLDYTDQPIDYDIYIPRDHPSGLFWFHPHAHGLALNQVSEGLAGIITIGSPDDYLADTPRHKGIAGNHQVRHLTLKDIQILSDGTVLDQEDPEFCEPEPGPGENRQGYCYGTGGSDDSGTTNPASAGKWVFSINGQVFPTIPVVHGQGEVWRFTNASGSRAYELALLDDATGKPLNFQVLAVDGVSIDSGASLQALGSRLKGRISPSYCSSAAKGSAICATSLKMFPSSRVEVWVSSRQAESSSSATLVTRTVVTGDDADRWPSAKLAKVIFKNGRNGGSVTDTLSTYASSSSVRAGILSGAVRISDRTADELTVSQAKGMESRSDSLRAHIASLTSAWAGSSPSCKALGPGHYRRIFLGVPTGTEDGFGLGYEEVDAGGHGVPGTFQELAPFDHANINVCLPLAPGNQPVQEAWELVNVAAEDHNFHIHQTKFRVLAAAPSDSETGALVDNVPVPHGNAGCDGSVSAWRTGGCLVAPVKLSIPFSQVGDFVYHCHILEHEDGGMMAHIRVVPN